MRRLLPTPADEIEIEIEKAFATAGGEHLRVQFVASLDGAISAGGVSAGLSGRTDRQLLLTLRGLSDAVLVGAGTARAENYGGVRLDDDVRRRRVAEGRPAELPIVVVTNRGRLDPGARLFQEAAVPPIVLTTTEAADGVRRSLGGLADVIAAGEGAVDLTAGLAALRAQGLMQVHCEGGPSLFGHLLAADLVDELCLTLAPMLAGACELPRIIAGAGPLALPRRTRLTDLFVDDEGFLYARHSLR